MKKKDLIAEAIKLEVRCCEMITAAETLYIASYKELIWAKNNLGEVDLTERYRSRWAAMYEMLKALGIDPSAIAVKHYEEIFS